MGENLHLRTLYPLSLSSLGLVSLANMDKSTMILFYEGTSKSWAAWYRICLQGESFCNVTGLLAPYPNAYHGLARVLRVGASQDQPPRRSDVEFSRPEGHLVQSPAYTQAPAQPWDGTWLSSPGHQPRAKTTFLIHAFLPGESHGRGAWWAP